MLVERKYLTQFFVLLVGFVSSSVFAQNGPGGIGDRTGTSILEGWFESADIDGDDIFNDNPLNNATVTTWIDKSGNTNNLSQIIADNRPLYVIGTYNAVSFINSGVISSIDYLNFTTASNFAPGTAYFVMNATDAGSVSNTLLEDATQSLRFEQFDNTGVLGYTRYLVGDYTSTLTSNYGANSIVGFVKYAAVNTMDIRQNAGASTINIGSSTNGIPTTRLGAPVVADAANYLMMEVLIYSSVLNAAQIRIIENYLSSKYGNIAISNDNYSMDLLGFNQNVAGIGQTSVSSLHTDSQSSIVRINTPSGLTNGEFLFWGHDGGALVGTRTDIPGGIDGRLQRVWGVNEVAEVGTVNVQFDLSGSLQPVTTTDLRLLIDTDNDGIFNEASTSIISGATSLGGGTYQFAGVDLNDTYRFTIASINLMQTPLPIGLMSFNARTDNRRVFLSWETATETNNDYFSIFRSTDGRNYTEIGRLDGVGTSTEKVEYTFEDSNAPAGQLYYKLQQTDFDGTAEFVGITSIKFSATATDNAVYPNPVKRGNWLTLKLTGADEMPDPKLVDVTGRITTLKSTLEDGKTKVFIPANVTPGVYFLHFNYRSNVVKVMIE